MSLNIIIIGAGEMGARHAQYWTDAGATITAICDPDTNRAENVAKNYNARVFSNYQHALELGQVASVCTPTSLHAGFTVGCLEAGLHVLCEKPIALSMADALRMREAAAASEGLLRIGFMRRFDAAFVHLRECLRQQRGSVMAQVSIAAGIRPKRLMHDKHANGGPIIDMCCHIFDMWKLLFDAKPELAHVHGFTFANDSPLLAHIPERAVDSAAATFLFAGGHVAQLQISWGLPSGVPFREQHSYKTMDGLTLVNWNYRDNPITHYDGVGVRTYSATNNAWQTEIQQFYNEINAAQPRQLANVEDGIDALELSLAMLEGINV